MAVEVSPVHVVVAVDGDSAGAARHGEDLVADLLHVPELARLVRLAGLEETARRVDRAVAAADEGHRDRLSQLELRRQAPDLPVVVRIGLKCTSGSCRSHPAILSSAPDGTAPAHSILHSSPVLAPAAG